MSKKLGILDLSPMCISVQTALRTFVESMLNTRPDIVYAVNTCARFSSKPNYTACRSVLRILAYVSKTYNVGITYYGTEMDFHGFSDEDWGGNRDNARFTTDFLLLWPVDQSHGSQSFRLRWLHHQWKPSIWHYMH